jgi:hypothetical protein
MVLSPEGVGDEVLMLWKIEKVLGVRAQEFEASADAKQRYEWERKVSKPFSFVWYTIRTAAVEKRPAHQSTRRTGKGLEMLRKHGH